MVPCEVASDDGTCTSPKQAMTSLMVLPRVIAHLEAYAFARQFCYQPCVFFGRFAINQLRSCQCHQYLFFFFFFFFFFFSVGAHVVVVVSCFVPSLFDIVSSTIVRSGWFSNGEELRFPSDSQIMLVAQDYVYAPTKRDFHRAQLHFCLLSFVVRSVFPKADAASYPSQG